MGTQRETNKRHERQVAARRRVAPALVFTERGEVDRRNRLHIRVHRGFAVWRTPPDGYGRRDAAASAACADRLPILFTPTLRLQHKVWQTQAATVQPTYPQALCHVTVGRASARDSRLDGRKRAALAILACSRAPGLPGSERLSRPRLSLKKNCSISNANLYATHLAAQCRRQTAPGCCRGGAAPGPRSRC